jgi:hypothetical protein
VIEANWLSDDWANTVLTGAITNNKRSIEGRCLRFFIVGPSLIGIATPKVKEWVKDHP